MLNFRIMITQKIKNYLLKLISQCKENFPEYNRKFWGELCKALLLLMVIVVGYIILLYVCKMLWFIFISTSIGSQYLTINPDNSERIAYLFARNLASFSVNISIISFLFCLGAGVVGKLLDITKSFTGKNYFILSATYGFFLSLAVAAYIQPLFNFTFRISFYVAVLPTMFLLVTCVKFIDEILPDPSRLMKKIPIAGRIWEETRKTTLSLLMVIVIVYGTIYFFNIFLIKYSGIGLVTKLNYFFDETTLMTIRSSGRELLGFSTHLTLKIFFVLLIVCSISQFMHINVFLMGKNTLLKMFIFGLPCTILAAIVVKKSLGIASFSSMYTLSFIPALLILSRTLLLTNELLPEAKELKDTIYLVKNSLSHYFQERKADRE